LSGFRPDRWPTVIPRLFTSDVVGLVNFLRATFDAHGEVRHGVPVEVRIGDSIILVSDGGGVREPSTGFFYVYVEDADAVYRAAIQTGAFSIEAPADMPYGDRRATLRDAWGNIWQIATYRGS
jgi:PhnB protein